MTGDLEGETALVVGASRGIGRAVAEAYVEEGARVAAAARSLADLEDLAASVSGTCLPVECDVQSAASVEDAVETAREQLGELDVVVNSAGTIARGRLHETDLEADEAVIDVNLLGALRVSKAALPSLLETEGALIHVSSEGATTGIPDLPAYCASKGGLEALVRQLAVDYGPDGVSVTGIAPGTTKTSINEAVRERDPSWVDERAAEIPYGRLGEPEDVANVAVFLAREDTEYVTGDVIRVDGGSTA